jgi:hypothetical protein
MFSSSEGSLEMWRGVVIGPCALLEASTPRIGAKRQIGSGGNLWECYDQVWNTINKERYISMGHIHRHLDCKEVDSLCNW